MSAGRGERGHRSLDLLQPLARFGFGQLAVVQIEHEPAGKVRDLGQNASGDVGQRLLPGFERHERTAGPRGEVLDRLAGAVVDHQFQELERHTPGVLVSVGVDPGERAPSGFGQALRPAGGEQRALDHLGAGAEGAGFHFAGHKVRHGGVLAGNTGTRSGGAERARSAFSLRGV